MAITINSTPATFNAAYRNVSWQVDSDDVTIVRIIADVYVNDVYETTIEKDPELGTTDQFKFDISRVTQDLLTRDLETTVSGNTTHDSTDSSKQFKCRFFEVLDSGSGFTTTWAEDGAGTGFEEAVNVLVVNSTLQHTEQQNMDLFSVDTSAKRFLSNRPTSGTELIKGDPFFLDFLTIRTVHLNRVETDAVGGATITLDTFSFNPTKNKGQILVDSDIFLDSTVSVSLRLLEDTGGNPPISQSIDVKVIQNCLEDTFTLYWQNPLGGIDSQPFRSRKIEGLSSEIVTHRKILADSFNVEDRGENVLEHRSDDIVKAWTEINNKATMRWLREIGLTGRNAFIYDNGFVPVIITDFSEQVVDTDNFKGQFDIEFRFSNAHIAQRG
ncbi:MAG: hypothetical protein QQN63_01990 [Nitrosopumilus sp.]